MATLANTYRSLLADTLVDLLDGGTIRFETSGNAITPDSNATAGTIDHALIRTSAPATVLTCTVSTTSGDFVLSSLSLGNGDTLDVASLTVTMPAS